MGSEEIQQMKAKDLFEVAPLLTGRTQIDATLGYNNDDFEVDLNNIVNLKNKTSYLSISPAGFVAGNAVYTDSATKFYESASGAKSFANVELPHGSIITGALVTCEGNGNWKLCRMPIILSGGLVQTYEELTSAAFNTEDTSISNATVDNSNYSYFIITDLQDDVIAGARITYTTDYD